MQYRVFLFVKLEAVLMIHLMLAGPQRRGLTVKNTTGSLSKGLKKQARSRTLPAGDPEGRLPQGCPSCY